MGTTIEQTSQELQAMIHAQSKDVAITLENQNKLIADIQLDVTHNRNTNDVQDQRLDELARQAHVHEKQIEKMLAAIRNLEATRVLNTVFES
jgi:hypothetical protein